MKIFAENFRGFSTVEVDLEKITFLVGDNSSGKSSILHLVDSVLISGLTRPPRLNEDLGVSEYDYFSPYFDYANVIFGYLEEGANEGKDFFSKIITVRRKKNSVPEIILCSYLVDGNMITVGRHGEKGKLRVLRNIDTNSCNEIIDIHKKSTGYSIRTAPPKGVSVGDPATLFSLMSREEFNEETYISKLFGEDPLSARLVSPIRALPEKFYTFSRKLSSQGLHFATMWHDFSDTEKGRIFASIEKFGRESKLFENIFVRRVSNKIDNSPLIVSLKKGKREFLLNQVGVGVSQVVPILVETVFALRTEPKLKVLFQQPELHLHPVAQAALGSFLYRASKEGLRGVIESHSSYLLDRFRAELRENAQTSKSSSKPSFSAHDAVIIFCENSEMGNTAYEINIDETGKLQNVPESYYSFFIGELTRTMF